MTAQAASDWWSGTGSNCRPSAFQLAAAARPAVAPAPRTRRCHIGTRACPRPEDRLPSAPAGLPAIPFTPSVRPGMTHRDEQSMRWFCRWTKITRITMLLWLSRGSGDSSVSAIPGCGVGFRPGYCWFADKTGTGRSRWSASSYQVTSSRSEMRPGTADESFADQQVRGSRISGQAVPGAFGR
jgi:hypothetical protein